MATVLSQKRVHWHSEMVQLPSNNGMLHFPQHRRVRPTPLTSAIKLSPPSPPKRVYPAPSKRVYPIYAPSPSSSSSSRSSSSMNLHPSTPTETKLPRQASAHPTALAPHPPPSVAAAAPRVSIHRALRMGTCTPLDVSSTSKHHWEAWAHERACHPPLRRIFILVETSHVGRYNIEVTPHNTDGFVSVGDVFQRTILVLRDYLKLGGARETCSCGSPLDGSHGTESSQLLGLTVRSPEGDQFKWKLHLKLGRTIS